MTTVTISHNGTTLQVSGNHRRGYDATLEEPGQDEHFEVDAITDSGVDVTHIHDLEEIAGLALEAHLDHLEGEACEAADRQREERQFTYGVAA